MVADGLDRFLPAVDDSELEGKNVFDGNPLVVERLKRYQEKHGVRFAPAPLLVEMAKSGARFF